MKSILPRLVVILVVTLGELSQGPAILHWVVQRNAKTAALITFTSFAGYADALKHKAELEAIRDPFGRTNIVAIESLPDGEFPK
jgi:hypothetical protein